MWSCTNVRHNNCGLQSDPSKLRFETIQFTFKMINNPMLQEQVCMGSAKHLKWKG